MGDTCTDNRHGGRLETVKVSSAPGRRTRGWRLTCRTAVLNNYENKIIIIPRKFKKELKTLTVSGLLNWGKEGEGESKDGKI